MNERAVAVIGDIHGHSNMLRLLIKKIRSKYPDADLYSLGDLIDRGPDSRGVIQTCVDEDVKGIYGNHDQWFRELIVHKVFDPFCIKPIMGGKSTLESYGVDFFSDGVNTYFTGRPPADLAVDLYGAIPYEHKRWVKSLPPYRKIKIDGQTYWLLHAGLTTPSAISNACDTDDEMMEKIANSQSINSILWTRPNFGYGGKKDNLYRFKDGAIQIFGHSPHKQPLIKKKARYIMLDTGCGTCEPFTLSAIVLPSQEIIQVKENF